MDTIVRIIGLPITVKGLTIPDEDGIFNVYINKDMSHEMQWITYQHEMTHIKNSDFSSNEPVVRLEEGVKNSIGI